MAVEIPKWTYKSEGDKQTASEMNQLAQSVIINATELSNIKDDVAELSNKTYNPETYSGMGRVILRKNMVGGVNVLTQAMINQANTIYEIRYDFDLNGVEIIIPDNCILMFKGGGFKNAHLILGKNVSISNGNIKIKHEGKIVLNDNVKITNCSFTNISHCFTGHGNLYGENCKNIVIKNCLFDKQIRQELGKCSSIDLRNCENFLIDNIISHYTEGENIIVYEGSGIITNCQCHEGWSGIGTTVYGTSVEYPKDPSSSTSIIISNNIIYNPIAAGITINNSEVLCNGNQVFFNNTSAGGPGIRLGHAHSKANNCTVSNNLIKWVNTNSNGQTSSDRGIAIDAGDNNIIDSNTILNVPTGITSSVTIKTGTIISNNVIKGASIVGIDIFSGYENDSKLFVKNNKIECLSGTGIGITRCNVEIFGNEVSVLGDEEVIGIDLRNGETYYTRIYNNYISTGSALTNLNGDIELCNNILKSGKEHTITMYGKSFIKNNTFNKIQIKPSPVSIIIENNFYNKDFDPIYIYSCEDLQILNNVFEKEIPSTYAIWCGMISPDNTKRFILNGNIHNCYTIINNNIQVLGDKIKIGYNYEQYEGGQVKFLTSRGDIDAFGRLVSPLYGSEVARPSMLVPNDTGYIYYEKTNKGNFPIFWDGEKWLDSHGNTPHRSTGTSDFRPTLKADDSGVVFFDKTINKPIWWTGSTWVDATGASV